MKKSFELNDLLTTKTALLISGIVCAIPFVFKYAFILPWICFIPVVIAVEKSGFSPKKTAKNLFIFGFGYYFVAYSWFTSLYPLDFAGFSSAESVLIVLLAVTAIPAIHSGLLSLSGAVCALLCRKASRFVRLFAVACAFVFAELLQSVGTFAFPWGRVFVTQSAFPVLLQSASVFGSYFITFLVVGVNSLFAYALMSKKYRKKLIAIGLSVFALNICFGVVRMAALEKGYEEKDEFRAVALQGNYPSKSKWTGSTSEMFLEYMSLAQNALKDADKSVPSLVAIPETALTTEFKEDGRYAETVKDFCAENNASFVIGAFADNDGRYLNAIFTVNPDRSISAPYAKRHLVPFGEYVPYRSVVEKISPDLAGAISFHDFDKGTDTVTMSTPFANVGTLICYDSIFPSLCRQAVNDGAEVVVISTNDSWFGTSPALTHHLAQAQMRAIENNVPIVRAANTGISAIIEPNGTVISSLGADKRGYISENIKVGERGTLYTAIGDVWIALCALYLIIGFVVGSVKSKRT